MLRTRHFIVEINAPKNFTELLNTPERKTTITSHMSLYVRVQLFRLFSQNPHDSCAPCEEKHGVRRHVHATIPMIKTRYNSPAFLYS